MDTLDLHLDLAAAQNDRARLLAELDGKASMAQCVLVVHVRNIARGTADFRRLMHHARELVAEGSVTLTN